MLLANIYRHYYDAQETQKDLSAFSWTGKVLKELNNSIYVSYVKDTFRLVKLKKNLIQANQDQFCSCTNFNSQSILMY